MVIQIANNVLLPFYSFRRHRLQEDNAHTSIKFQVIIFPPQVYQSGQILIGPFECYHHAEAIRNSALSYHEFLISGKFEMTC
jgi:hypothetical protein